METKQIEVSVYSLWAGAYALAQGVRLIRIEPGNTGRARFYFDDENGAASAAINEWRNGTAMIPGRVLMKYRTELLAAAKALQ
jgi:hypothetical protein